MPRKNLIRSQIHPYHVTTRSNNKEWFTLSMPQMWKICLDGLKRANERHPVKIHAFVLMQNHYHLMLTTPDANVDKFMYELNYHISRTVRIRTKRINHVFGQRYKWSLIETRGYHLNVIRYVYQNPLKKNLAIRCEDYPYSTLFYYVRKIDLGFPLTEPLMGESPLVLDWFNQRAQRALEEQEAMLMKKTVIS